MLADIATTRNNWPRAGFFANTFFFGIKMSKLKKTSLFSTNKSDSRVGSLRVAHTKTDKLTENLLSHIGYADINVRLISQQPYVSYYVSCI